MIIKYKKKLEKQEKYPKKNLKKITWKTHYFY